MTNKNLDDDLFKAAFGMAADTPPTIEEQEQEAARDAEWEASKIGPPITLMNPLPYILRFLGQKTEDDLEEGILTQSARPELVTMSSWFMLHEMNHCGGESDLEFINNMDVACDYDCSMDDDHRRVMAFPNTPEGREAIQLIHGWVGQYYPVWMLSVEDGQYHEVEFGPSPHAIDFENPLEVENVIDDFVLRHQQSGGLLAP